MFKGNHFDTVFAGMTGSVCALFFMCLGLLASVKGLPANVTATEEDPGRRIVGGSQTDPFQYPWLALLSYSSSNQGDRFQRHCGASLIHPKYVLTAAHCTFQSNIYVVLNRYDLSIETENSERFRIKRTYRHPKYNNGQEDSQYDIALLELSGNSTVKPVSLASVKSENMTLPNTMLTVAGWGVLQYGTFRIPDKLQQVDVPVVGTSKCQADYPGYKISDVQICAGDTVNGGKDSCQGDSGGPLFFNKDEPCVIGVVSYGIGCAQANYPGVYTNVIEMMSWITSIVPENELSFDIPSSGATSFGHPSTMLILVLLSILLSKLLD